MNIMQDKYGKDAVKKNFEKVPMELFHYLEIGLIQDSDFVQYIKLQQYHNSDYGYAFPTISQLRVGLNKSKTSILNSNRRLEECGLIKVQRRGPKGNNIYRTCLPLEIKLLKRKYPEKFVTLDIIKEKRLLEDQADKKRLQQVWDA